ncbi:glycine zipper family protein [Pseudomaricurvus alcaniphilus]|uniref:glycine zipper family protein n=1 Tax=Pseudomaricurvus alcaniphilus TaxID=1166482 RepID=UPI00140BA3ED|nr:glycine zipper family protein [Pseudomaricurvus alcaniphilus]NHN37509.1 glycine zipper family protein [Pseudomaricurvus alcaniphilus]
MKNIHSSIGRILCTKPTLVLLSITILVSTGCARNQPHGFAGAEVIIDRKGVDMEQYHRDLYECRQYTQEVATGRKVVGGAAGGAVVGGLIGAAVGNSDTAKRAAGAGAVAGGAKGAAAAGRSKQQVLKNCIRGRGYRVLN